MRSQVYAARRKRRRSLLAFLLTAVLLILLLVRMDFAIRPNLCAICQSETEAFAARLLADSMTEVLADMPLEAQDFTEIRYDSAGNLLAVETQSSAVNQLQAVLLSTVQAKLDACRNAELKIYLGSATGVWLFAGRGPHITVRLMPIGSATITIISELTSAGVNQTCHTITAKVEATVQAAMPFAKTTAEVAFDYLLVETMLVGDVPETYLEIQN